MPTIKDVAREAGVSIATVSYVLNGKANTISDETSQQVWEAARRIGYIPNVTARNLRASRSRLIGYEWHDVPRDQINPVLDRFTYYLSRAAELAGYHVLTFTSPPDDPVRVYDELLRSGRVDAFVVSNTSTDDARIRYLIERDFPFVSFGRANPAWDHAWVDCEGRLGVNDAVQHLYERGHRRIAMVAWPEDSLSGEHRLQGYREAVARLGLPAHPAYVQRGIHDETTGRDAMRHWLALPTDLQPTAVVSVSDLTAIGVMNEAERCGLEVGVDFSVVGFDDAPMSQYLRPALTTLRQPIPEIGETVIGLLEKMLNGSTLKREACQRFMPPQLIERASVATLNYMPAAPARPR